MSVLLVVGSSGRILRRGSLTLDLDRRLVHHDGALVATSAADFGVLHALMSHRNVPIGREKLAQFVFGPDHQRDPRQIDVFVARLRHSLEMAGAEGVICTVAGRGYAVMDEDHVAATWARGPRHDVPRADQLLVA